jgi:hypothetical protein
MTACFGQDITAERLSTAGNAKRVRVSYGGAARTRDGVGCTCSARDAAGIAAVVRCSRQLGVDLLLVISAIC